MDATLGNQADTLSFYAALAEAPYSYDFYQTLRRLEGLHRDKPRWGTALRPVDEPVRLGQNPELAFPPSALAAFEISEGRRPRLQVRLFGLFGPNGPLPIHITEYARERLLHAGDPTLCRFLDIIHHRFLSMFYRAWAQAQPHVNMDRPADDRFSIYVGSFIGIAPPTMRGRDSVPDFAKLFHTSSLIRQVRNAEGLAAILQDFFEVPTRIEQFVAHWMPLGPRERTYLNRPGARLGRGAVIGGRVWDRQHKFRIHIGPVTLAQYRAFLPVPSAGAKTRSGTQGRLLKRLVDWVRTYLCFELDWDIRLRLRGDEIPRLQLGRGAQLGWTTWLGAVPSNRDAADLCLNAETFVDQGRVAA